MTRHLPATLRRFGMLMALAASAILHTPAIVQAGGPIGGWVPSPAMTAPRDGHTATVLKDGGVLLVGGPGAEIYDPVANSWSQAGTPLMARTNATATLLAGGRVLVAAGIVAGRSVPSAEIHDPTMNKWTAAASMAGRRYDHTATLLADGRVLIVGGTRSTVTLDSAELYDPKIDAWSPAANLPTARTNHVANLLPDGRVLVAGGGNGAGGLTTAEIFDPAANSWSSTAAMTMPRGAALSTRLGDGRVLVVGGIENPQPDQVSAEIFNPMTETWSPAGPTTQPLVRDGFAITSLRDGRVFICGGAGPIFEGPATPDGYVYDPELDRWSAIAAMSQGRVYHTASLLPNGKVLVTGGRDAYTNGTSLNTTEIFDINGGLPSIAASGAAATPQTGSTPEVKPAASRTALPGAAPGPLVALIAGVIVSIVVFFIATALVRRGRRPPSAE